MSDRWAKDATGMVVHDNTSLEPPYSQQKGYYTPNEQFFVCYATSSHLIYLDEFLFVIYVFGVEKSLSLLFDDLLKLPHKSLDAFIECAGNHRVLFETVLGHKLDRREAVVEVRWELGAVGNARWEGVALRDVLALAGVKSDALLACPKGLDTTSEERGESCPMPIAKALDPDTLLALRMNGEPLPPDHGFPVRVVAPGWVGTYSIKWVGSITVSTEPMWVPRNTEMYVMMGDDWEASDYTPAKGPPIYQQTIKSSLTLPWPARLQAGRHTIHGYARSPNAEIDRVEWSDDEGASWHEASLFGPNQKYAWVEFHFDWSAEPGDRTIMTRATDNSGMTQPDRVAFNHGGYLFNMAHPHPIKIRR